MSLPVVHGPALHAQTNQGTALSDQSSQTQSQQVPAPAPGDYVFHVTTREVVVEVVARDRHSHPVSDLKESDFVITEDQHHSQSVSSPISVFRVIDPDAEQSTGSSLAKGVMLPLGGRCEIRSTVHYELAFHPANWSSGYHTIRITTKRSHVTLSYRGQFYVGTLNADSRTSLHDAGKIATALEEAACYHPAIPNSILLSAARIDTQTSASLRYRIQVLDGIIESAGGEEMLAREALQYGVCTFDLSGHLIGYWHFSSDRRIPSTGIESPHGDSGAEIVQIPRDGNPRLVRVAVLETETGNVGAIDLSTSANVPVDNDETSDSSDGVRLLQFAAAPGAPTRGRPQLGSVLPRTNALCGDVCELPPTTQFLPSDFRKLNAVGAIYAQSLNVPEQILTQGLPGSSARSEWFGVDYYGEFWVKTPGKYTFLLNADDGADLYIDDRMLIDDDGIHPPHTIEAGVLLDAGRHTIHLPYFQGPTYVNLILKVRPPGGELKIFNLRDFARPIDSQRSSRHAR
ncbi:MAG: PA14 domain-containing protein [Terracidiphilus sp.]